MCNHMFFYFSNTAMRGKVIIYVIDWFVNLDTVIATNIIAYRSKMSIENIACFGVIVNDAIIFK